MSSIKTLQINAIHGTDFQNKNNKILSVCEQKP